MSTKLGELQASADFDSARFSGQAAFNKAEFKGSAGFDTASFSGHANFENATFSGQATFYELTFSGDAKFDNATFTGNAKFFDAKFSDDAKFENVTFLGVAHFSYVKFLGNANFRSIDVHVTLDFYGSDFYDIPDFRFAKNRDRIALEDVVFSLSEPTGWVGKVASILTGIRGSNKQTAVNIRQLRGIASDTNAIDTERDLMTLERNAEVGAAWSGFWTLEPYRQWVSGPYRQWALGPFRQWVSGPFRQWVSGPFWHWASNALKVLFSIPLLFLYRWSSNYGRSIKRPLLWLFTSPFIWFEVHCKLYLKYGTAGRHLLTEQEISALKSITLFGAAPISATQRTAYTSAVEDLLSYMVSDTLPLCLQLSLVFQSIFSLIFIFLIGLALRNYFRLK